MPRRSIVGNPINWEAQPLGEVSDEEVGRRLGVSASKVGYHRKVLGIEAYRPSTEELAARGRMGSRRSEIDWSSQPLGKESDRQIALRLGVSSSMVRKVRLSRGIPAARQVVNRPREFRVSDYAGRGRPAQRPPNPNQSLPFDMPTVPVSIGWLNAAKPQPPAKSMSLPDPATKPEPTAEETARLVELGLVHVHVCPMCLQRRTCSRDDCQAMGLETEDGAPYSYKTCPGCLAHLEEHSGTTGYRLAIKGGTPLP